MTSTTSTSCTHIKADGIACGSPALTGSLLCYFHARVPVEVADEPFALQAVDTPAAILAALSSVLQAVALKQIDTKRANLLLRGLALATRLTAAIAKAEPTTTPDSDAPSPRPETRLATETPRTPSVPTRKPTLIQHHPNNRLPRSQRGHANLLPTGS